MSTPVAPQTQPKAAKEPENKVTMRHFASPIAPTWCPGCGDFAIWTALKMAFVALNLKPTEVILCFDIGCNSNMADKINAYVIKGLHGRAIPLAEGVYLGNKNLPVIAIAGDGGTFDEGMQHFIHAFRSNYNMTLILHNNCDFGLTTGQATPTTPTGQAMNSSPYGTVENRLNPTQLALSLTPSFVAKGYTGDQKQLTDLVTKSIQHKGFSYLEVLQHCPTYNKFLDQAWYKDKVYKIEEEPDYDPTNLRKAYDLAAFENERIATGILYQNKESLSYLDRIEHLKDNPAPFAQQVVKQDISELIGQFK